MTDFPEFFNSDDGYVNDTESPFYGFPLTEAQTTPDPNDAVLEVVLERLGVDDFSGIVVDFSGVDVDRLRGNRFPNLTDAIVYLAEAGVFTFGDVTIDDEGDIGIAIGYDDDEKK